MIPVASHQHPSYKGWVNRFFQELPSEYLQELIGERYLILIYKHKQRDQYYAILMQFNNVFSEENEFQKPFRSSRNDEKYFRKKELTRYLKCIGY